MSSTTTTYNNKYTFNYNTSNALTGTKFSGASLYNQNSTTSTDLSLLPIKQSIISNGIIPFTIDTTTNELKYLMIQRKHSVGFIDFIRGKYCIYNKNQIVNLLAVMTNKEHNYLLNLDFDLLWKDLWGNKWSNDFKKEEINAKEKLETLRNGVVTNNLKYNLSDCINEANVNWDQNDWGFPKGRKNFNETDLMCALREFNEETGIETKHINIVTNIMPYDEIFTGSNFKSYKHKYYLGYIHKGLLIDLSKYQQEEVGNISWLTLDECLLRIREYHIERKEIIKNVDLTIKNLKPFL